jgi:hypothetical protein
MDVCCYMIVPHELAFLSRAEPRHFAWGPAETPKIMAWGPFINVTPCSLPEHRRRLLPLDFPSVAYEISGPCLDMLSAQERSTTDWAGYSFDAFLSKATESASRWAFFWDLYCDQIDTSHHVNSAADVMQLLEAALPPDKPWTGFLAYRDASAHAAQK